MASLRILIADDHEVVRRGLRSLLGARPNWEICGEAVDGRDAVQKARRLKPDVVMLDISMPHLNGLDAARIIRKESPESEILILSQHESSEVVRAALEAGARGYIAKADISRDLLSAVEAVSQHRTRSGSTTESIRLQPGTSKAAASATSAAEILPAAVDAQVGADAEFLAGSGEMTARMRDLDWSKTKLGRMENWPQSLRTSISICLASRFPIVMYWGPEFVVLYNDAYSTILGSKHPWALGQACRDCWAEIWETIGPMLEGVVRSGTATWSDDLLLMLQRHGYAEECYFSFSFSPIRVETGSVGGVFTAVMETSEKVIGARRLKTLRDLAVREAHAKSEQEAWQIAAATLGENAHDFPFAILYKLKPGDSGFEVVGAAGIARSHQLCTSLCISDSGLSKSLRQVAQRREPAELTPLTSLGVELPRGIWEVPPEQGFLLPIGGLGQESPYGILLVGLNPHKQLAESYRTFLELVGRQIGASVAEAISHEEERRRAEALAEIDRAKTLFFSNVSHEFRTPLSLILGPLEDTLSAAAGRLSTEDQEKLAIVHRNGMRLLKLVNSLLDFSRIEAGRVQAAYEPTDLSRFTAELASGFRAAMEKAGLQFRVQCEPLPEPVYVDREMWEKIVLNLLSNAFKYTFEGQVSLTLQASNGAVLLEVKDSGIGIPKHEVPHLFDRFHRVEGARGRTHEGTGIGLALVQELTKLHGGSVSVQSKLGKGSAFTVRIPLGKDHLPENRVGAAATRVSTTFRADSYVEEALQWLPTTDRAEPIIEQPVFNTSTPGSVPGEEKPVGGVNARRELILVADDNADMRDYICRLLGQRYRLHAARNGEEALSAVRELNPDLILMDVMMPVVDGFGVLRAIRENSATRAKPVILLSARAGEESRVEGLEAGADDYLTKPFTARELLARVGTHLAMARMRGEAAQREQQLLAQAELELAERKRVEEALKNAQNELEIRVEHRTAELAKATEAVREQAQLLELANDAVIVRDMQNKITSWNLGAQKTYGWSAQEVLGKVTHKILDTKFPEALEAVQRQLFETGSWEGELEHLCKDGSRITVESRWVPQYDKQGQPVRILEINRDLTRRKQSEQRLAEQAQLLDLANDAIFVRTLDHKLTYWNQGAERLYGWKKKEVLGKPVPEVLKTGFPIPFDEITAHLRKYGTWEGELTHAKKDGTRIPVESRWTLWTGKSGEPLGYLEINTDVTERKQAEQNLRTLTARLLQLQDEERRRIARELHDSAGQLLVALDLNLAAIQRESRRLAPAAVKSIADSKELIQELSKELRTISHLLHPPLLDESGLQSAVRWYVEGFAERSKIPVGLEMAPDLGRLPRDVETTVFRMIQECLTNVHRHSESATAEIRIERSAREVTVEVSDKGKGMATARRKDSVSPVTPGVGLQGMRERIRQLGGRLEIKSAQGRGTLVRAVLPVSDAWGQTVEESVGAAS
ncbi:MAG TPA: response regulator [Terriglobales bacterium]|nr:response regulator [Terriglobales bacterium]